MTQATPPPNEPVWFYMYSQQKLGPVDMGTLLSMIRNSTIDRATPVWREGMAQWQPAGTVPDLAVAFNMVTPLHQVENYLGLNLSGLIVFIILICLCWPLCWLPWVIDSLKAKP